jgi:hypothetical protein
MPSYNYSDGYQHDNQRYNQRGYQHEHRHEHRHDHDNDNGWDWDDSSPDHSYPYADFLVASSRDLMNQAVAPNTQTYPLLLQNPFILRGNVIRYDSNSFYVRRAGVYQIRIQCNLATGTGITSSKIVINDSSDSSILAELDLSLTAGLQIVTKTVWLPANHLITLNWTLSNGTVASTASLTDLTISIEKV